MNKIEKLIGLIAIISLLLKLLGVPYSGILLTLTLSTLAIIYYPLGGVFFNEIQLKRIFNKKSYTGISATRLIGSIGVGIGLSILCLGSLFKLQHWGYSDINLEVGLLLVFIAFVITLIRFLKSKDEFYRKVMIRIVILGSVGILLIFI